MKPIVAILIIIIVVGVGWTLWDAFPEKNISFTQDSATNLIVGYAKRDLARQLGVSSDDIHLISSLQRDWPDACLGIQKQDVVCADVITPGYQLVLEAGGKEYRFRSNIDGSLVMRAP